MPSFDICSNMLAEWAEALALYLGRNVDEISSRGLQANDFSHDLEISW